MIPLLKLAIEAHGGLERWRRVQGIDCKLTIGGGFWQLKGLPQGLVDVALHVEPADKLVTITPFGPEGAAGYFRPDRVWIQNPRGDVVQERSAPRRSFEGHTLTTPWDKLHELYFVSYAFLNYLSTPFLFAEPGFEVVEGNPYFGAGEKWRRLHVRYPAAYPTHSREQTLYFNEKGLLQRLDYVVEVVQAGASHFCLEIRDRWRNCFSHAPTRSWPRFEAGRAGPFGTSGYRTHDQKYRNPSEEVENMKLGASTGDRGKGTAVCVSIPPRSDETSHKRGEA